jgi:UDPglucose 6-dehydrogenase
MWLKAWDSMAVLVPAFYMPVLATAAAVSLKMSKYNLDFSIVEATDQINARQRKRFFDRILQVVTPGQTVAVWGLSFKPKTDDMREAPSLDLLPLLVQHGCQVKAYDPEAMEVARKLIPVEVQLTDSAIAAAQDADAVVVLTEWDEFRGADLVGIERALRGRTVFDGRNVYEPAEVRRAGLEYYGIGIH